jgi:hypothetical protein
MDQGSATIVAAIIGALATTYVAHLALRKGREPHEKRNNWDRVQVARRPNEPTRVVVGLVAPLVATVAVIAVFIYIPGGRSLLQESANPPIEYMDTTDGQVEQANQ